MLNKLPASVGAIGADQVRTQPTMAGKKRHQHLEIGLVDIDDPLPGRSVRARPLLRAGLPRVPVRASNRPVTTCAVQYRPPQDTPRSRQAAVLQQGWPQSRAAGRAVRGHRFPASATTPPPRPNPPASRLAG